MYKRQFQASVNRTGRTSMEIGVRVTTEDLVSQVVRHTNSCYFTMVAVGPDGGPWAPVAQPRVAPGSCCSPSARSSSRNR